MSATLTDPTWSARSGITSAARPVRTFWSMLSLTVRSIAEIPWRVPAQLLVQPALHPLVQRRFTSCEEPSTSRCISVCCQLLHHRLRCLYWQTPQHTRTARRLATASRQIPWIGRESIMFDFLSLSTQSRQNLTSNRQVPDLVDAHCPSAGSSR